jgi:Domain of unknown function (DUF4351)
MPVYVDILDNEILEPAFKRGLEEGKLEGESQILRGLIERRFGQIPKWAEERLAARSAAELEALSFRILDAASIEELLPKKSRLRQRSGRVNGTLVFGGTGGIYSPTCPARSN